MANGAGAHRHVESCCRCLATGAFLLVLACSADRRDRPSATQAGSGGMSASVATGGSAAIGTDGATSSMNSTSDAGPSGHGRSAAVDASIAVPTTDAGAVPPLPTPGDLPAGWSQVQPWIDPVNGYHGGGEPAVAVDSHGTGHVLFGFGDDGVTTARVDRDANWSMTEVVGEHPRGTGELAVALAADDSGFAIGTCYQGQAEAFSHTPNGDWVALGELGPTTMGHTGQPKLALGPAGTAFAIWLECDSEDTALVRVARFDGSSWGEAQVLDPKTYCTFAYPSIGADGKGRAVAVWRASETLDALHDHVAASYYDGTSWNAPEVISGEAPVHAYPNVAMDSDGHAIALSAHEVEEAMHFHPDTGWEPPIAIGTAGADNGQGQVAFDTQGRAIAIWGEIPELKNTRLIARQYDQANGWGEPIQITHPASRSGYTTLAMNRSGRAIAAWWVDSEIRPFEIWASLYDPETGWQDAAFVYEGEASSAAAFSTAINASGQIVIGFMSWFGDQTKTGVYAIAYSPP